MNTKKNPYTLLIYFTIILLAGFMQSNVSADDWRPAATKNGVQTFLRSVEDSKYKAVRGEAILPVNVAKLVAVINDAPACPEWADLCAESYIQHQPSDQEAFIYTHNDMPWPVKDREVLAHVKWSKNAEGQVTMQSTAVADEIIRTTAKEKNIVRIERANASWQFTPVEDGNTHTIFEIHMNPNGAIPGWLLNRLIINSPFTTFENLTRQAAKAKYVNAELPF